MPGGGRPFEPQLPTPGSESANPTPGKLKGSTRPDRVAALAGIPLGAPGVGVPDHLSHVTEIHPTPGSCSMLVRPSVHSFPGPLGNPASVLLSRLPPRLVPVLALGLLFGGPVPGHSQAAAPPTTAVAEAAEGITEEAVFDHLSFLASDELRGRDTPSPGLEEAAAYLVNWHIGLGLEPAGEDGTYLQRFPFRFVGLDLERAALELQGPDGTVSVPVGEEGFVNGYAEEAFHAPLTFVSTIQGMELDSGALEGRVAAFPLSGAWGQALWSTAGQQADFARAAGATAVIHVLDRNFAPQATSQLSTMLAEPSWTLGTGDAPQLFIRRGALEGVSQGWDDLLSRARDGEVFREDLEGVELTGTLAPRLLEDADPPNVLAQIPGRDPELRNEYIVLSAHFDHVGVGEPMDGDSIYNGADDNASGTTALLEVARALRSLPEGEGPRRTVVFAHVSGEEKGLLGSEWFVDNPTIPIENVVANINADMVGGDSHPDTVVVLGKEYSSLGPLVDEVNGRLPELNLTTAPDLWPEQRLFYRSDQYNFMRKEIPSLFFFTGLHECYHRPCDTIDFVSSDKVTRISRLITHAVMEIANRDERPEWTPEGLAEVREMVQSGR